jgi:proteasome assembly chaperone (PAC2) family protein
MNFLRNEMKKMEKDLFEIYQIPQFQSSSLIIGWQTQDIGKISSKVIDFLNEKLGGREIAEIKPLGFFPLGGTAFRDDVIQVPESKFWACEKNDLLLFKSDEPKFEWYKFLNAVLDLAESHCKARELYTINGTVSSIAHVTPRRILTVFNQPEFQKRLRGYGLEDMNWQGPPAISSYLLWVAQRRGIPGVSLWPEVPFYLAAREDPEAIKLTLSFLDRRFNLGLDLRKLDKEIKKQNDKIARLREENSEINKSIIMLERGLPLNEEEQTKLAQEIYELLKEERGWIDFT